MTTARSPDCDAPDLVLLEEAVHPVAGRVDERQGRLIGHDMTANPQTQIGDVPVGRRAHLGELEVQLGLPDGGEREPELRIRIAQGAEPGLGFGQRRLGLEQVRLGLAAPASADLLLLQGDVIHRLGAFQGFLRGGLLGQHVLLPLVLGLVPRDDRRELRRHAPRPG